VTVEDRARQQAEAPEYWNKNHSPYRNLKLEKPEVYAWANEFGPQPADDPGPDTPIANNAIRSMRKLASAGRPFFLAVGFIRPHVPLKAPQRFFDLYDPARMPLPPDFASQPRGPADTPPDELRANIDLYAARPFTETEAREAIRAYYACVSYMDAELGRVLDELDRLGLANNTIIVFWGDHGWHLSEKGMWAKGTTFEVAARGPLFIADPRQKTAGRTCRRVVQYLDMYPTLVDLCGLPRPDWLEGLSLRPLLDNPDAPWDHPAFTVQPRGWFLGRSIRTERWRYTEWDEGRRGAMLFDHDTDPYEMRNLVNDPAHQETVSQLRKQLRESKVGQSMQKEVPQ
jgi:arylsulfatase A-like enzyme